jgi:hypothetical protein
MILLAPYLMAAEEWRRSPPGGVTLVPSRSGRKFRHSPHTVARRFTRSLYLKSLTPEQTCPAVRFGAHWPDRGHK